MVGLKPPRHAEAWDAEDDGRLHELAQSQPNRREIAKLMGRSIGAIETRMARLGLVPPRTRHPRSG